LRCAKMQKECAVNMNTPVSKVSNGPIIEYLGFQAKLLVREYTFKVREAGLEREFTLFIENKAFITHLARYQDAPAICALRLNLELAAHSNHPLETQYAITDAELDSYRKARAPVLKSGPSGWKKAQEDL
jgi:hypothetical protein